MDAVGKGPASLCRQLPPGTLVGGAVAVTLALVQTCEFIAPRSGVGLAGQPGLALPKPPRDQ